MKYFAMLSSSFVKLIIIFSFSFLFAASTGTHHEGFLKCLTTHISSHNSTTPNPHIIYTRKHPYFFTILNSTIQNDLYSSPSTPKPLVIITPTQASHVQATVYCSKKHGIQIRTRSGGHDYHGLSYVSYVPFVVIELRKLHLVSVDVENKSAWIQAGAMIGELYYWISNKSETLGFPAGDCHTVGVGGTFGGGGYGYLSRKYGLSIDNIIDAKLVDAKGRILDRKAMGEDLFWAIRGGGAASFGIVLAWKVLLVPVPSTVTVFEVKKNFEDDVTKKFFQRYQRSFHKIDEDLTIFIRFQTTNSTDEKGNGKIVVDVTSRGVFHGSVDSLLKLTQKKLPELVLQRQHCKELTWVESFLFLNFFKDGESPEILLTREPNFDLMCFKAKSDYVQKPIPNDAFEGLLRHLYEEEVGRGTIDLFPYGGKMDEILESTTPFPHRAGNLYKIQYLVRWDPREASNKHVSLVRKMYRYMTPFVSKNPRRTYLNFRDLDIGVNTNKGDNISISKNIAHARNVWGPMYFNNNFDKLLRIKTLVDPTNFFTHEQAIPSLLVH